MFKKIFFRWLLKTLNELTMHQDFREEHFPWTDFRQFSGVFNDFKNRIDTIEKRAGDAYLLAQQNQIRYEQFLDEKNDNLVKKTKRWKDHLKVLSKSSVKK